MSAAQLRLPRAKKGAACKDCSRRKRKCVHFSTAACRNDTVPYSVSTSLLRTPTCNESRLCLQFATTLRDLRVDHTWLQLVPCRIGHDELVDMAVTAVIKNNDLAFHTGQADAKASLYNYVKSVKALRMAMATRENNLSDQVLMSVALLAICESLMRSEMFACFAHWGALAAILTSRPASWQPSDLTRAILYHIRNQTFHIPCARGQVSPFDHPRWYTLEPAASICLPPEIIRLKRLSNELQIRLPRLILLIRKLRANIDAQTSKQAIELALELSQLTDETAESKMLHRIKVVKTSDTNDAEFVPFSFQYADLGELEAAVVYWKAHLFFGKIQLRLVEMFPNIAFNASKIKANMARWGVNIIMSHQYAFAHQQHAHARGMVAMPTALIALWSLWDSGEDFRGISTERWRAWNRERMNNALEIWQFQATDQDLDTTSELLAGGPLEGMFVAAYSQFPFWAAHVPSRLK